MGKRFFTLSVLILFMFSGTRAFPWGSVETGGGAFATHQFLNKKAYDIFEKKKAFQYSGFPSLQDIQKQSGVSAPSKRGLGPDDPDRSDYDWHWYNPRTQDGKTPEKVKKYHNDLKEHLSAREGQLPTDKQKYETAHNAAYLSHFIQDMTCPFHVFGISNSKLDPDRIGTEEEMGPFFEDIMNDDNLAGEYGDPALTDIRRKMIWKRLVELHLSDDHKGTNFFDATYYDGVWPATTMTSSHFEYEAAVEVKYKMEFGAGAKWMYYEKRYGEIPEVWKNGMDAGLLTHKTAEETLRRIGTKDNPGPLWIDRSELKRQVKVPYYEWWRAIQLSYVLWRSSFSALHAGYKDIKLVKIPNKEDAYKVHVRIWNWEEKEDAYNVKVRYQFDGDSNAEGKGSVKGSIKPAKSSDWTELGGEVLIKDPEKMIGNVLLDISGQYKDPQLPDSGKKTVEYPLSSISFEAFKMDNVVGSDKISSKKFLEDEPKRFNVVFLPGGEPDTPENNNKVAEQHPSPGEWVGRGETVNLTVYGEYLTTVPQVIGIPKADAVGILTDAGLNPIPGDIMVEYTEPGGMVVTQKPLGGKVKPGSDIIIMVSKKKPAPPPVTPAPVQPAAQTSSDDYDLPLTPVTESEALMDIKVVPQSVTIKLGQNANLTAVPIDIEGNPVVGNDLDKFTCNWIVNVPAVANISGNGRAALVSGIKPGTVQAIVTAGGSMGIANIIIEQGDPADGWDERDLDTHQNFQSGNSSGGFSSNNSGWQTSTIGAAYPPPAPDISTSAGNNPPQYNGNNNISSGGTRPPGYYLQNEVNNTGASNVNSNNYQNNYHQQQNVQNQMNFIRTLGQVFSGMNNVRNSNNHSSSSTTSNLNANLISNMNFPAVNTNMGDPVNAGGYVSPGIVYPNRPGSGTSSQTNTSGSTSGGDGSSSGGSGTTPYQDPNAITLLDQVALAAPAGLGQGSRRRY